MATVIINEKTRKGRIILDLIEELGVGQIIQDGIKKAKPNNETLEAMQDAIEGNTIKCDDFNDYLQKVK